MGIVNVTPDSFSDGGQCFTTEGAIAHAYRLYEEGADIIDIGGESSRPGAVPVPADEEMRRVIPVIREIAGCGKIPVSIDTVKYDVASEALAAGAAVINDISGLGCEPRFAGLAKKNGAGLIIMHIRGNPRTMQSLTEYKDIVTDIRSFLLDRLELAKDAGVEEDQVVTDPGIGFGKTPEQNLLIVNRLEELRIHQLPILAGISRKSVIGKVTGKDVHERQWGTAGAVAVSIIRGADIVRVHDVKTMKDVVRVADAIRCEMIFE